MGDDVAALRAQLEERDAKILEVRPACTALLLRPVDPSGHCFSSPWSRSTPSAVNPFTSQPETTLYGRAWGIARFYWH
jgi:hypothetical protein